MDGTGTLCNFDSLLTASELLQWTLPRQPPPQPRPKRLFVSQQPPLASTVRSKFGTNPTGVGNSLQYLYVSMAYEMPKNLVLPLTVNKSYIDFLQKVVQMS